MIAGLRNGQIVEIDQNTSASSVKLQSHSDGEVWGLNICANWSHFATTGDDNKILAFNLATRTCDYNGTVC